MAVLPNSSQVGCTHVTYDGYKLSDTFEIQRLTIPLHPRIDAVDMTVPDRPGTYFSSRNIGTRDITMRLLLNAQSRCPVQIADAWTGVSSYVTKSEPKKLYLDDVYVWAMLVGTTMIDDQGYRGAIDLTFRCFDPYIYGDDKTVNLAQGSNTFSVTGDSPTWPVITLTVPSGPATVGNGTDSVVIPDATGTTVIDMEAQRCTVGGVWRPVDPTQTDFWALKPGSNTVTLSAGSATLAYTERWL